MASKMTMRGLYVAMTALFLTACGGNTASVTAQRIGPAGGQVTTAGAALRLDVPPGALSHEVEIRVREVEPRQGEVQAFEIEPAELQLEHAARVTVKIDDASGAGKHSLSELENEVEHAAGNEIEDVNEHTLSGEVHHLGRVGVKRADDAAQAPEPQPNDAAPHA